MDIVRLAIVYETGQASARLAELNAKGAQLTGTTTKLGTAAVIGGGRLRGMALAGSRLASGLSAGDLSAKGLAASIGRLAGPTAFGALAVTVINVINALEEYKRISDDVTQTIDAMQTSARDARADVQRLLGERDAETPTERAIKRIRDAVAQMRKEATRLGGGAGKLLNEQAAALEGEIQGIGARGKAQKIRDAWKAEQDFNQSLRDTDTILVALNAGPMERLQAQLDVQRKRYEKLIHDGMDPTSEKAKDMADALNFGAQALGKMQRQAALFEGALFTMADAIEEFAITGELAFTEFLDNILRLLWRQASSDLIGGLVSAASGSSAGGTIEPGTPKLPGGGKVLPSVQSNVTFNVTAIDAQGVASFLNTNGPQIAAVVAGQASRSRGLRGKLTRG